MASIALGIAGAAIGGAIGGSVAVLGTAISAATIGGAIGSALGSVVDSMIVASMLPDQRIEGARLDSTKISVSTEGAVISRVNGRVRIGGNIIWATDFREEVSEDRQGGGKGGGPSVTTVTYRYYASFALALCDGPITGIGRIWADGELMDLSGATYRVYLGDEEQEADPFIESKMGAGNTPAYRGTAYILFEELLLENYGNRLPQISVEVFRALADDRAAEGQLRAITLIPGSGEYAYARSKVTREVSGGDTVSENVNADPTTADIVVALDRLQASVPGIESVSLVVSWFGTDLRCGECEILPGVETRTKDASMEWSVASLDRSTAHLVSQDDEGRPVYGGTPTDQSVLQAIQEIKSRGLRVTFYPFVMMDVPADNDLPNPYDAGGSFQGAYPWRGRITCFPAPGTAGTVDQTAAAATQVDTFFERAWGFRNMILHYAQLCANAGGVDSFLIGSEMPGLTTVRSAAATYPAVTQMIDLADDCRAILGGSTEIGYAADWSEYFGHHPADGSGDVYFHLDPLWATANIDFVGIDNYMPLSDWRDGFDHIDAQSWPSIYDHRYLQSNIEGGEGFDWFYASAADRAAQVRTPITDGAAGKPWVFRYKDVRSWWQNQHYNRPGGVESGTPTAWVPQSKPIRFTEFGCPAVDRGTNQPNVFYDPKSSESFVPYFSRGWRDDMIQRSYLEAVLSYWADDENNPTSGVYAGHMIDTGEAAAWTWDARPYPFFPALGDVWSDGGNWNLGHWLSGRIGSASLRALVRELCLASGMSEDGFDVSGLHGAVEGYPITAIESARSSIATLAAHFGFDATESGGVIHFKMRGSAPVATYTLDQLLAGDRDEPIMIERAQETELPQALKWSFLRADEEYDQAAVEDRRRVVSSARVASEAFPFAVPPEEAYRRVRRALMERWVARETATFSLPPSQVALDPTDVISISHDGRLYDFRLLQAKDNEGRNLEALLSDRLAYDLPPGAAVPGNLARATVFGGSLLQFLNLPQLRADHLPHQPLLAAYAKPWPGSLAVYRSPADDGFTLLASFDTRATFAETAAPFNAGPASRFDMANSLLIDTSSGTFASVSDVALFNGENTFAVETSAGVWEIVQAGTVELVSSGRYRLTRLLRGQRGTEAAISPTVPAGARVLVLNTSLAPMPISEVDVGLPWNWRVGPASLPIDDDSYQAVAFTPNGRGLQPFSPCHIAQPYLRARTPGDLTIEWTRRSRDLAADSWNAVEVPMIEEVEAYEVDIMDGGAVLRTLSSSTPSVVYTEALQVADFGAALGPGDTLDVRVAQMSAVYGRGAVKSETLQF